MTYLYSFLFVGFICLLGQILMDKFKFTPGHVTSLFVVVGAFLDLFSIYDKIILKVGAGAIIPITSFGHLLMHGAMENTKDMGLMAIGSGMLNLTAAGITTAVLLAFVLSLIFKPKS